MLELEGQYRLVTDLYLKRYARGVPTEYYDSSLREAAFAYLDRVRSRCGGVARFDDVAGFEFGGERVALMDRQRGIRAPRVLDAALSFRTVHADSPSQRPYDDSPGEDGYLRYKWRGKDPNHPENRALRAACMRRLPLIWFHGIASGTYLPIYPVWLAGEEPASHQFVVALERDQLEEWTRSAPLDLALHRRYATRVVEERLHQPVFRARVLAAYETHCALCRFRHPELLDAAHIRADSDGGEPVVTNGIAMCKIHHAAFDNNFMGINADFQIRIRPDLLAESDGPTLRALQALHQTALVLPRQRAARPDRNLLEERFEAFKKAG